MRRRTWHCTYVLDRLLSLQLGRPCAIRNRDCSVKLPSRLDDMEFDVEADNIPLRGDEAQAGDYFISVISFSHVVGQVMHELYCPSISMSSDLMLGSIERLDAEILYWRSQLPRKLRFDLGHAFEKSIMYKRQVSAPSRVLLSYPLTSPAKHACCQIPPLTRLNPSTASLPTVASGW